MEDKVFEYCLMKSILYSDYNLVISMAQIFFIILIGFLIEFVVTYVLVLTVYAAAADEDNDVKGSPPLAIGLAITIGHLFAVSIIAQSQGCIYKKDLFIHTYDK